MESLEHSGLGIRVVDPSFPGVPNPIQFKFPCHVPSYLPSLGVIALNSEYSILNSQTYKGSGTQQALVMLHVRVEIHIIPALQMGLRVEMFRV